MERQFTGETTAVSVLMPVYNGGRYLDAAVESILRQDWPHFEFLIIDDGSTDGSHDKLGAWAQRDARVRLLRTPHQGIAIALNRGLEVATYPVVVRMDADDVSLPHRISQQVGFLDTNPRIAAVGCSLQYIDPQGKLIRLGRYPETPFEVRHLLTNGSNSLAHPAVAFRRDLVLAVGGYRPQFNHAEDFDLWTRLIEHHEIANIPEVLLQYRIHPGNVSRTKRWEQALAAHSARFAGLVRRRGLPDPLDNIGKLTLAHLLDLPLSPTQRQDVLLDLAEAALASFQYNPQPCYVESACACFMPVSHIGGVRTNRIARDLAWAHQALAERAPQYPWLKTRGYE